MASFDEARRILKEKVSALTLSSELDDIKKVLTDIPNSENEKKVAIDQAFRDQLRTLLVEGKDVDDLTSLVSISVKFSRQEMSSTVLPFTLLADILDCVTLDRCLAVFQYIESNVSVWLEKLFYTSGKNLLLRLCNNLLRRLSKPQNTVFCGRIQIFLAHLFPLEEKSALNLTSQFHSDNVTIFKSVDEIEASNSAVRMETDQLEQPPVDVRVYRHLWTLQNFFMSPTQCFSADIWPHFKDALSTVLGVFSNHQIESLVAEAKASSKTLVKTEAASTSAEQCSVSFSAEQQDYFPKYLTSEKLMGLELNDANFRRQILVQVLVIFQYLTGEVKFKSQAHTLSDAQSQWVKQTTQRVYELLQQTPLKGKEFADFVKHVLSRETNWISWKNETCPSFVRGREEARNIQANSREKKRAATRHQGPPAKRPRMEMGNGELTRLWNICPDNLEACSAAERQFSPALGSFFEEAIDQSDPEAMIEDQYKVVNDSNFAWRALRLLSRRSPYYFQTGNLNFKNLAAYLEHVIQQIAKDQANVENGETHQQTGQAAASTSAVPSDSSQEPMMTAES